MDRSAVVHRVRPAKSVAFCCRRKNATSCTAWPVNRWGLEVVAAGSGRLVCVVAGISPGVRRRAARRRCPRRACHPKAPTHGRSARSDTGDGRSSWQRSGTRTEAAVPGSRRSRRRRSRGGSRVFWKAVKASVRVLRGRRSASTCRVVLVSEISFRWVIERGGRGPMMKTSVSHLAPSRGWFVD